MPTLWLPGNHGDVGAMSDVLGVDLRTPPVLDVGPWRVVGLDSAVPDRAWGSGGTAFHRPPRRRGRHRGGAARRDRRPPPRGTPCAHEICRTDDAELVLDAMKRLDQIRLVLSGHLHWPLDVLRNGRRYLGAPSAAFQLLHGHRHLATARLPAAARLVELFDDGTVGTRLWDDA